MVEIGNESPSFLHDLYYVCGGRTGWRGVVSAGLLDQATGIGNEVIRHHVCQYIVLIQVAHLVSAYKQRLCQIRWIAVSRVFLIYDGFVSPDECVLRIPGGYSSHV